MDLSLNLIELLRDDILFPVSNKIKVLGGLTLTKNKNWWKAILLVNVGNREQLRLYGWQKNKEGDFKVRQKFNISKSYAIKLSKLLMAFSIKEVVKDGK